MPIIAQNIKLEILNAATTFTADSHLLIFKFGKIKRDPFIQ